ncbi:Oidioi.mRNA.OKI2018_I69.PAR.g8747.t1.cds [Oikopleura dioica]|uniref:Oidioi.mRNA.OKI2018_I69.PAR.g8747.t1.cds n=1 Tax=Oikopleura dioica TaxID=34765 RepID=A0ABN7RMQ4_OIKDI|nr:Oidioi.mRNA.OKI2018_I69.PAR.g8747.t1.cds [Oikopleura dioica]
MRELCDEDELFRRFIDWAEDKDALQPEKNKCKGNDKNALDSILSGPHQRVTRYGLLLDTRLYNYYLSLNFLFRVFWISILEAGERDCLQTGARTD